MDRCTRLLFLLFIAVIVYLVANTGLISDDFDAMQRAKTAPSFLSLLIPHGHFYFMETPLEYFTHFIWYYFFNINGFAAADVLKILYVIASFYFIYKFFGLYVKQEDAMLVSFLFLFFPCHDSTVYCFMLQYLPISIALYLYAYYLMARERAIPAIIAALAASFLSYGSSVVALSVFALCCMERRYKRGIALLMPNILYIIYYLYLVKIMNTGIDKLSSAIDPVILMKQGLLQLVTFIDAAIGPSLWLKIYYSLGQLTPVSIAAATVVIWICWRFYSRRGGSYDKRLVAMLAVLLLLSFGMFAATNRYPQLAFNLGNRVTIFGSLLLAYVIVLIPLRRLARTVILAILIFSVFGISDHWKASEIHRQEVFDKIRSNASLRRCAEGDVIGISGNQYSKFGPFDHIEFLSEPFVTGPVTGLLLGKTLIPLPLNRNFVYKDGNMIDTRDGSAIPVGNRVGVYDSVNDRYFTIKSTEINDHIGSLPSPRRHWIQFVRSGTLKSALESIYPRLHGQL